MQKVNFNQIEKRREHLPEMHLQQGEHPHMQQENEKPIQNI